MDMKENNKTNNENDASLLSSVESVAVNSKFSVTIYAYRLGVSECLLKNYILILCRLIIIGILMKS